jgi:hypothetical protein
MLLCSVRARHDALESVAEGIGCDAVVVRRKLELSLSYAPVRWTTMACEENVPTGPSSWPGLKTARRSGLRGSCIEHRKGDRDQC